ncbi:Z1 domain-containing protein [Flavobacterium silvaticum]|uniref:DEAD/DEAH box helicase family protein n=1 Tax=Flavobacterium silvaticum TaxID=1852020 RepID=A0A972JH00_9FLAO|nr:Z1 domain-containing protein [Flavobacterium silvaticum]NMH28721.1 DEAD/DEAH box helicase family protein [Flavobacterium silvaticum]
MFDLNSLKQETTHNNRYDKRLNKLISAHQDVERIKSVVENAILNIGRDKKSFVIYGEPQSGKTEMMIALTAKLLDEGNKIIVVLLNDSVQLLGQNLERFQRSGLAPSPKKFSEILMDEIKIGDQQWVIFCKKNASDLQKLITKLGKKKCVIIDDEADFATPNSKINHQEKSRINELTGNLLGEDGIYIGVTATPARLDLNNTHENVNEHWIDFPPHSSYTGQDIFFPVSLENLPYTLTLLPDQGDDPKYLTDALFSFMVNVGYLNTEVNDPERNYSFLIHTSGKKEDHVIDYKLVLKLFEALKDEKHPKHNSYFERIYNVAQKRYPGHEETITRYVISNRDRNNIVVMNSDKEVNAADNRTATDPTAPFTITIGGNIVSRGVTFNNLLSMFFTRDVKHKLQQDTYIQRARMFGSRQDYLKYFDLIIPKGLYLDWQKCFIFHRLSLESRKLDKKSPVWLDGARVSAVASSSIDNTTVAVDRGEMSFSLFEYDSASTSVIIESSTSNLTKLEALSNLLGPDYLPPYLITYIKSFLPSGDSSLAVHEPKSIDRYADKEGEMDRGTITRAKGFIGKFEREVAKFPNAIHHINILFNKEGKARLFYKYEGNIRFLKTSKS